METAAQTKAEAAKGDQQAILKLARDEAAKRAGQPPQPATVPSNPQTGFAALA